MQIISGQCLPNPATTGSDIVDPYITIEIFGEQRDCTKQRTQRRHDNGMLYTCF